MLKRLPTLLALALVATLLLAACGGDDDDDGAGDSASVTPTTAAAPTATEAGSDATSESEEPPAVTPTGDQPATAKEADAATEEPDGAQGSGIIEPPARSESIPVDGRVLGEPGAPVAIVEYGDFQ